MRDLAGSLYLISTAAFALIAAVVGIRLLLLSRKCEATLFEPRLVL